MKTPAGAIPDSVSIVFQYKKNGKTVEFDQTSFPTDFDSTYEYVDRKDKVVRKGNGLQAKILDFSLQTLSGADTTAAVLGQTGNYLMVFAKTMDHVKDWQAGFDEIIKVAQKKNLTILMVTADADNAANLFKNIAIVKCDATVLKTAARVVPTYFVMHGATVVSKTSYAEGEKVLTSINGLK